MLTSSPFKDKIIKLGVQRDYKEIHNKRSGRIISIRGSEEFMPEFRIDYSWDYSTPPTSANNLFYTSVSAGLDNFYV